MAQWFIAALLLFVFILDVLDGITLLRWNRELHRMERDARTRGSLLRWYVEGAQQPTRRIYMLLWATMVLTLLSLLGEQPAWLIGIACVLAALTWLEWRFGHARLHSCRRRALARHA